MNQSPDKRTGYQCLVCKAQVGQLFPFCEWCGAKHSYTAERELLLTGAICQACGFQAEFPFARCPDCGAQRCVVCPACGLLIPARRDCGRCGLHYRFFARLRREHAHTSRVARAPSWARALACGALMLTLTGSLLVTPGERWSVGGALLCVMIAAAVGVLLLPAWRACERRLAELLVGSVAVLETYDPAEALNARHLLRECEIDGLIVPVRIKGAASSPPAGLRRLLVGAESAERAHAVLNDHGFNVVAPRASPPPARARRARLRLLSGGAAGRGRADQDG